MPSSRDGFSKRDRVDVILINQGMGRGDYKMTFLKLCRGTTDSCFT